MLEKHYKPGLLEKKFYKRWEKSGGFSADPGSSKEPYTIMMPPPNVTGSLHMGHGLTFSLQDILIRYHRKTGRDTLWQPGTDHAGIATQMVVERQLAEDGVSRQDLGRSKFLEKVWEWKNESGGTITEQLRSLGSSPDWSREKFTMDPDLSMAVTKVFVKLYKQGLIYRDKRLVNWDPKLLTAISDLEVQQVETQGKLWHFKYPIEADQDEFITVATTRPETMLGDSGIAVHPDDPRYTKFVGKKAVLPLVGRLIPIVADEYSDMEKGSGAVKITPAHDFNDFEVGRRHELELINIFDEKAKLNKNVPEKFVGLDRYEARKIIVAQMEELGLLSLVEDTTHVVPHGDRSQVPLEPWLTDQWYCNAKILAQEPIKAVQDGRTRFVPKNWENTFFEWMKNIQPWCISRQLWWGHQIPAWFGPDGQVFVEETEEAAVAESKKHYGETVILKRDEDVLDTWFSSALWPFSTLGWPNQTKELEKYYPGEVLVTGFDIIFFWVARMMMMGLHFMKEVPFQTVYIHALVRDEKGQKMSKSKGNVLDPLVLIGKYGSDALRFTLAAMAAQGRDIKLAEGRIEGYRNFATKLWNAARFAQLNSCSYEPAFQPNLVVSTVNKWIISETVQMVRNIEIAIESYRFNDAANLIYQFTWATFCDWYLEFTKPLLANSENVLLKETRETTSWVLKQIINSLNPLMPYITEELWEQFEFGELLINEDWPTFDDNLITPDATKEISWVIALINEIRSTRSAANINVKSKVQVLMKKLDKERISYVEANEELIIRLGNLESLKSTMDDFPKGTIQSVVEGNLFGLVIAEDIDFDSEKVRISKDLIKIKEEMAKFESKLSNEKFLEKAPEKVIQETRNRLDEAKKKADKLDQVLEGFNVT
ncbi:MAG: valine--tRNA ligase [Pseudomonadota bacterium]|nr:valine--tRNA ligase [Pseudomonadota bacterium]